jgi:N-acetylglucosaminyl-diphospho-decaprenol L-rhamnosyltransferase
MPQGNAVTAILVAYNSTSIIGSAIASLQADPCIGDIIVVDNGSKDKTAALIKREFPKIKLIENKENLGFGPANNIALMKVATPYALLVNPDAVMSDGAVDQLLAAAVRYPEAAILAPALFDEQDKLHVSYKRDVFARENSRDEAIAAEGECCADYVSGAVMLFNMPIMKKIGFFDPNIFLYYEDDDICLRVRQAGHSVVYVPQARAIHLMGASSGAIKTDSETFRQKHMTYSRLYMEEKYRGDESALTLAAKLHKKYSCKLALYRLQFNRMKIARYKGRLQGVAMFNAQAQLRQAA